MLRPHYLRLSSFAKSSPIEQTFPTGKGFGGSSLLRIVPDRDRVFPIVSDSISFVDPTPSICIQASSPLIIEVSKIFLLALWFWCSIGADFCFNSVSSIGGSYNRDV
ncbi:hypothetical protein [Chamaesiphon sp. VAR_48_metabat_135_sub]|uniref:hypothetical protein n=1 Tax=Chamaesiphon sp. VAR_48_metabat_135_sub TaxID=2964699 RepID=UPI00286A7D33|nr:hypothetical protein [Chamaesiphon sp. VAR_48_metabat_135_sub]